MNQIDHQQRDAEICRLCVEGHTLQQVADQFHLTRERVRQIIQMADPEMYQAYQEAVKQRKATRHDTKKAFLGVAVRQQTRDRLVAEAADRKMSISALADEKLAS